MIFELKPLPFDYDALEPHISARTLEFHYDKHHKGYLKTLEKLIGDKPQADRTLEQIVLEFEGAVFNAAAQVWNHDFYWQSLSPTGGGQPGESLADALKANFGDIQSFRERFADAAKGHFGSGWAWLVATPEGGLQVVATHDAENPLLSGQTPLLTVDVWEHAYYLDVQNDRGAYVDRVLDHLINWRFAEENLEAWRNGEPLARRAS